MASRRKRKGSSRATGYGKKEVFGRQPAKISRGLKKKIKARQQSGPKSVAV